MLKRAARKGGPFLLPALFEELITFAKVQLKTFLQSGIIERYCTGNTSPEENAFVAMMQSVFPEIAEEIRKAQTILDGDTPDLTPQLTKVKLSLMRNIYKTESVRDKTFLPLMDEVQHMNKYETAVKANNLSAPGEPYKNIFLMPLPSTPEVQNFALWLKQELKEEIHFGINEFVLVMQGSCIMDFDGLERSYSKGEVIFIPPGIKHKAVVTSAEPMFGLVQRQIIATA